MGLAQPEAPRRIIGGIEVRIAAAHPWIILPRDYLRGQHRHVFGAKPGKLLRKLLDAVSGDELPRLHTRRSTGKQGEDAVRSRLLFIPFPHRSNRKIRTEGL